MSSLHLSIISGSSDLGPVEMQGEGGGGDGVQGEMWACGTRIGVTSVLFMSLPLMQGCVHPAECN